MRKSSAPSDLTRRHERQQSDRLDNFVDGAFAFTVTLMVIGGAHIPKSAADLAAAVRDIPAFAACFAQLAMFWRGHVAWRERCGLTDQAGLLLSLLLVFFALIFVFPLHLVFSGLFNTFSGGYLSPGALTFGDGLFDLKFLFVCYGLSFACMGGTIGLMFLHGARTARRIPLAEQVELHVNAATWAFMSLVAIVSMLVALVAPSGWWVMVAGLCYPLLSFTGLVATRVRRRLQRATADEH